MRKFICMFTRPLLLNVIYFNHLKVEMKSYEI